MLYSLHHQDVSKIMLFFLQIYSFKNLFLYDIYNFNHVSISTEVQ